MAERLDQQVQDAALPALAERRLGGGPFHEPGERRGRSVGLDLRAGGAAAQRLPVQRVGDRVDRLRVGFEQEAPFEHVEPVLAAGRDQGVGLFAGGPLFDRREEPERIRQVPQQVLGGPGRLAVVTLERVAKLEGEGGLVVDQREAQAIERSRHPRPELLRLVGGTPQQADLLAVRRGPELAPQGFLRVGRLDPAVGLPGAAGRQHLRLLARAGPPARPAARGDDADHDGLDFGAGQRTVVAGERAFQQLGGLESLELLRLFELLAENVPFREQAEHLAGRPESHRNALDVLEVHLEDVKRHVDLGDAADAAVLHLHDVARLEREQVAQPVHLVPELVRVLPSLIQIEILEQAVQVGFAVPVELAQGCREPSRRPVRCGRSGARRRG